MPSRPDLPNQKISFNENARTISGNILQNATDADGDTITVARVNDGYVAGTIGGGKGGNVFQGKYGTLTIAQDGTYTYELNAGLNIKNGQTMVEEFKIKIRDSSGMYDQAYVSFDIGGEANRKPVAVDDFVSTNSGIVGGNVLFNDSDPDGDTLHVGGVIDLATKTNYHITDMTDVQIKGVYGTLTISSNGAFTYQVDYSDPDTIALGGAQGVEKFAYKPHDGQNGEGNNTDYALLNIAFNSAAPAL
ncbi:MULTISPECIES: Ig-like domain-containing protein [unclassified Sphingomonas]|uniref:Ig-like domain-containing protein n=1 Tax=unclassified Sphingomonas TaxID=196159 RepID=UPI002780B8C7|nr:Ig-like domain-containing protein [Sphingomonas sp. SORGH_AS_0879]MDQ1230682.1 VCBS repeat-containing protein [Sphingomonas sp. SORGH_AS_0879]